MQRYESYKPSGIQWVENIPSHWGAERAKWLFNRMERPVRPEDDVVTAFRDGQVTLRTNRRTEGFTNAIQEHGYQGIRKGDLVIHAMDAFAGAIGVSDSDGKSTPVYAACVPRGEYPVNSYYYAYLLRYMAHSGFIESLSKGIRERSTDFRFAEFRELPLPIPDKDEQDRIVSFLDQKTADIDATIAKKERLIELFSEQRTAVITKETRGRLSCQTSRDSKIAWLGRVPVNHRLTRIGFIAKVGNGSTPNRSVLGYWNGGAIPWMNSSRVNDFEIVEADQFITPRAARECHLPVVKAGSLLIAITGEGKTRGMAAITRIDTTINQHLAYISVTDPQVDPEFLLYYLTGIYQVLRDESSAQGSTKGAITCGELAKVPVLLPPLEDQRTALVQIKNQLQDVDRSRDVTQRQIDALKVLRSTLICDAVSGKIKI